MSEINKKLGIMILLALFLLPFLTIFTFAEDPPAAGGDTMPPPAIDVSDCGSKAVKCKDGSMNCQATPFNCLFLEEAIGGKPNWDLYTETCVKDGNGKITCTTALWNGGSIPGNSYNSTVRGPIQAILTMDPSKQYQGPFGLLYGYVRLIYTYMSGLIIGVSVLFIVIGGIQITLYGVDEKNLNDGKSRIIKAIIGLIIWFTASLILYTINPTFFKIL